MNITYGGLVMEAANENFAVIRLSIHTRLIMGGFLILA